MVEVEVSWMLELVGDRVFFGLLRGAGVLGGGEEEGLLTSVVWGCCGVASHLPPAPRPTSILPSSVCSLSMAPIPRSSTRLTFSAFSRRDRCVGFPASFWSANHRRCDRLVFIRSLLPHETHPSAHTCPLHSPVVSPYSVRAQPQNPCTAWALCGGTHTSSLLNAGVLTSNASG